MRSRRPPSLRWPALALAVRRAAATGRRQQPTFRSGTQIVSLFATVTDAQKRLVPDLTQDDFEVFDNDKPQPLTVFDNESPPDHGRRDARHEREHDEQPRAAAAGAEQFLIRLLPDDKGKVGAFNDKIRMSAGFTNNRDRLVSEVKNLDYGNGTRLWDAVALSLDELRGIEGRRVILVFTDGDDTASRAGLGTVIDRARAEEVMVYAIGLESEYFDGVRMVKSKPDGGLRRWRTKPAAAISS